MMASISYNPNQFKNRFDLFIDLKQEKTLDLYSYRQKDYKKGQVGNFLILRVCLDRIYFA